MSGPLTVAVLLALSGPVQPPTTSLTIDEAIARALAASPEARAADARADIGRAEVDAAEPFPLNPVGAVQVIPRYNFDGRLAGGGAVGVTQGLPLFGRWGDAVAVARARERAAASRTSADKVTLVAAVRRAYIGAQLEKAQLEVLARSVDAARRLKQLSESQEKAGAGTMVDVNVWRVELSRTRSQQLEQEARYQAARATLARLMGDETTSVTPSTDLSLPDAPPPAPRDDVSRPDLDALDADVNAAQKDVSLQISRAWPDVTVGASLTSQDVGFAPVGGSGYVASTLSVSIPMPLFDRNQGGIARARANVALAEAVQRGAQLDADLQVRRARWMLASSVRAAQELKTRALASSDANVKLQQGAYEAGQIDASGLVLAQRTQLEVYVVYLDTAARARLVEVELAVAEGRLLKAR